MTKIEHGTPFKDIPKDICIEYILAYCEEIKNENLNFKKSLQFLAFVKRLSDVKWYEENINDNRGDTPV